MSNSIQIGFYCVKNFIQKTRQSHLILSGFLAVASLAATAAEVESAFPGDQIKRQYQQQREVFLQLHGLMRDGQHALAAERTAELKGYPLADHIDYMLLRNIIKKSPAPAALLADVESQRKRYGNNRSHRRLLGGLKNRAVELDRWQEYSEISRVNNAPVHPCDDLLAKVKRNQITTFDASIGKLWAATGKHTENCVAAFAAIIKKTGNVPTRALWQRTVALMLNGKKDQARELLGFYNKRDRQVVELWINGIDDPQVLIKSPEMRGTSEHHRRVVKYLLRRWSKEDLLATSNYWAQHGTDFGFSSADVTDKVGDYAVLAAKRRMPEAADMLSAASATHRGVRYWRIRVALREQNWRAAMAHIENLTSAEQQKSRWQYWRARSLAELGYEGAAKKIYQQLSVKFDYFGFLAADKLGISYPIDVSHPKASDNEIQALLKKPGIARALEFFLVDIGWEGRREWNRALENASEKQMIAAAQIALSVGWYDRAYAAIRRTGQKSALAYLFPMPKVSLVRQTAALNAVPDSFVYGVIRQESAFIPDVRSPAGAVGLMQLMPGTAADMGKKLGLKAPAWKLINSDLNIRLGIEYLSYVLQRFDGNTVLAAAAYNAGPHRVKQWVAGDSLPADVWVETIPFDETRSYVRRVLFNATVVDWRLKNSALTRLRMRMPDVLPMG